MNTINRLLTGAICLTVSGLCFTAIAEKQPNGKTPIEPVILKAEGGNK